MEDGCKNYYPLRPIEKVVVVEHEHEGGKQRVEGVAVVVVGNEGVGDIHELQEGESLEVAAVDNNPGILVAFDGVVDSKMQNCCDREGGA